MSFTTLFFWVSFTIYFMLYWTVLNRTNRVKWRNLSLLIVSYLFYASWDWRFLGIILTSSLVDYFVGLQLEREKRKNVRRRLLYTSVLLNLSFLGVFKYHNFFIESAQALVNLVGMNYEFLHLNWVLPVGISFYTFQTMSYTIDVYRREVKPSRDPMVFFTYIAFFPQLLAGPIERAKDLIPQFEKIHHFELDESKKALLRILWGVFKKVVIANRLAVFVNQGYANPDQLTGVSAIIVIVFFVIQLYCDFSGYCDIAIGSARLLGFRLSENFKRPLLAKNIKAVYQRWHITIHKWFRDYVFLRLKEPKTKLQWGFNVLLVFGLAGLWHGSGINFLLWGIINGLLIFLLDPIIDLATKKGNRILIFCTRAAGHTAVYLSLVFFRSQNLEHAKSIFRSLSRWDFEWMANGVLTEKLQMGLNSYEIFFAFLFIAVVFIAEYKQEFKEWVTIRFYQGHGLNRWVSALALSLSIVYFGFYNGRAGASNFNPDKGKRQQQFIYEEF